MADVDAGVLAAGAGGGSAPEVAAAQAVGQQLAAEADIASAAEVGNLPVKTLGSLPTMEARDVNRRPREECAHASPCS